MKPEKKLDNLFNVYIRLRDTKDGGYCVSCGKPISFNGCDAGHYIDRQYKSVRWDEKNCHAQCMTCNRLNDGEKIKYRKNLILKIGIGEVQHLEHYEKIFKPSDEWVTQMIAEYIIKIARLKAEAGER